MKKLLILIVLSTILSSCKKDLVIQYDPLININLLFDKDQERLNNIGQPSIIPTGHAAQTPAFNSMSVHYIELAPTQLTKLGDGNIIYKGVETSLGGDNAIYFDRASQSEDGKPYFSIANRLVKPGTYEWVRVSVTYQNYDILYNINGLAFGDLKNQKGTVASFVGYNTFLNDVKPNKIQKGIHGNKKQGFWAFETSFAAPFDVYNDVYTGESPANATTVVNPLFSTSPIPQGSCVVTGKLTTPLVITGKETKDITVDLSFSINKSFEWVDDNKNGQLDFYADATKGTTEKIVDMGLRGLVAIWR
jgi:hypothetical protein